ncbi:hypothetical protein IMSHALPRED_009955 [Imshaugia aleurites]|uniref:Uncharacterized protein n=1 Tax=Imshaugia aleurites TaxID=172621 RepID=A0A8H3I8B7_9LECA|nr:hypothetical protein IMSHALPRED_009955 [Imshaugia aleurites]
MASSIASTAWRPSTVLGIGEIKDGFKCIGKTKQKNPCENRIKKENRTRAKEILLSMSLTSPASNQFEDDLEELLDILLCWRHRKEMEQVAELMETWTRAIEEVVRRGGDEIMGEADDTISRLDADISDLMERRLRLVQGEERTQAGRERRGNGYPAPR